MKKRESEKKRERERKRERNYLIEKLNFLLNDRLKLTEIFIVQAEHN